MWTLYYLTHAITSQSKTLVLLFLAQKLHETLYKYSLRKSILKTVDKMCTRNDMDHRNNNIR